MDGKETPQAPQKAGDLPQSHNMLPDIVPELDSLSVEVLELLLDEAEDQDIFREVLELNRDNPVILRLIYSHANCPGQIMNEVAGRLGLPPRKTAELETVRKNWEQQKAAQPEDVRQERLATRIKKMSMGEKIRVSMKGNKEVRSILIRETTKQVVVGVLSNPKITVGEVEAAARSRTVPDDALRMIARNREWVKNYAVMYNLVSNAKTPAGIAIGFLPYIKPKDLQLMDKNKNLPDVVRSNIKRILTEKKKAK
ncbi:MAG: hypothetical protein M0Z52_01290 [Actinomycetota bacterium]|nr:hypothetical protein [Actinomycetota bacterium]